MKKRLWKTVVTGSTAAEIVVEWACICYEITVYREMVLVSRLWL